MSTTEEQSGPSEKSATVTPISAAKGNTESAPSAQETQDSAELVIALWRNLGLDWWTADSIAQCLEQPELVLISEHGSDGAAYSVLNIDTGQEVRGLPKAMLLRLGWGDLPLAQTALPSRSQEGSVSEEDGEIVEGDLLDALVSWRRERTGPDRDPARLAETDAALLRAFG